jgi:hypothetical protein
MAHVGRADEVIVGNLQFLPGLLKTGHKPISQFTWLKLLFGGGLHHLDSVLIGPGQQVSVITDGPVISGDRVGGERGVNMPQMRFGIGVIDGRGDVESPAHKTWSFGQM